MHIYVSNNMCYLLQQQSNNGIARGAARVYMLCIRDNRARSARTPLHIYITLRAENKIEYTLYS